MRRRGFTLLSVASLLLCVAVWYVGDGLKRDGATGYFFDRPLSPRWAWLCSPEFFTGLGLLFLLSFGALLAGLVLLVLSWGDADRRRAQSLCLGCGYDLRATPEQGGALLDRCPECGAVPTVAG